MVDNGVHISSYRLQNGLQYSHFFNSSSVRSIVSTEAKISLCLQEFQLPQGTCINKMISLLIVIWLQIDGDQL